MLILGVEPNLTAYKTVVRTDTLYERVCLLLSVRYKVLSCCKDNINNSEL